MNITFYHNKSLNNKLNKELEIGLELTGTLRSECDIVNPVILIESTSDIIGYNYIFIEEFNRYYFIKQIVSVRNNLWRVSAHVDVLMSFKTQLLEQEVILEDSEITGGSNYIPRDIWQTLVKTKTDIITFPSGLSENGEFILITAGG